MTSTATPASATTATPATTQPGAEHRQRVESFRARHHHRAAGPLVLPNAWDVASALLIESAGAEVVATTSAAVSWSLGYPDGDRLPRTVALDHLTRLCAAVAIPVTADIEGGYGAAPADVADTVRRLLTTGAVGINIEDSAAGVLRPPAEQAERIGAARGAAAEAGGDLFINARVDTYLLASPEADQRLGETLARALAFVAAGADGVFVPGVSDPDTIRALVQGISAPVNVMAGPGSPTVAQLGDLGVSRISVGPSIALAAYAHVRDAATELLTGGSYGSLAGSLGFADVQGLLEG